MQDVNMIRLKAHKSNLDRYARLLATNLTQVERDYIHRRIAEEHSAVARLEAERLAKSVAGSADPGTLIAARAAARSAGQSAA
jgi:hypothetical protein